MNKYIKATFIFVLGGLIGSGVTYKVVAKKFQARFDKELNALKGSEGIVISERELSPEEVTELVNKPTTLGEMNEEDMIRIVRSYGSYHEGMTREEMVEEIRIETDPEYKKDVYKRVAAKYYDIQYDPKEEEEKRDPLQDMYEYEMPIIHEKPYLIPEDEFGVPGYEQFFYTMYSDGVIADESDNMIRDLDAMFGEENLSHFGDRYLYNQDDVIYIRDDNESCEFEIVMDPRPFYDDVLPNSPYRLEE